MRYVWTRNSRSFVGTTPPDDVPYAECTDDDTANTVWRNPATGKAEAIPARGNEFQRFNADTGAWVGSRTAAQITAAAWTALRAERNAKLTACDWTQVPDSPMTALQRTCWAQYRQALRNMPETTTDPNNPTWPQEPD